MTIDEIFRRHYMKVLVGAWLGFCAWLLVSIIVGTLFPRLLSDSTAFWLMAALFASIGGLFVLIRNSMDELNNFDKGW